MCADTWFLSRLFGWTAPTACYAYFVVGLAINAIWLRSLVPLVYQQVVACFSYCMPPFCTGVYGLSITLGGL